MKKARKERIKRISIFSSRDRKGGRIRRKWGGGERGGERRDKREVSLYPLGDFSSMGRELETDLGQDDVSLADPPTSVKKTKIVPDLGIDSINNSFYVLPFVSPTFSTHQRIDAIYKIVSYTTCPHIQIPIPLLTQKYRRVIERSESVERKKHQRLSAPPVR